MDEFDVAPQQQKQQLQC